MKHEKQVKPQRSVAVLEKMTLPAVYGRDPMNVLSGEKPDQNRTKRSAVCLDARGASSVPPLLTTLGSPLV